jgi:uncharacterized protein (UPF0335 family)
MAKRKQNEDDEEDLVGHNSKPRPDPGGVAADQLRAFVERIERLEEEKKVIADDIKDVYAEAKGNGYDTKALRKVVSDRKKEPHELEEFETVVDLYKHALGMAVSYDDD